MSQEGLRIIPTNEALADIDEQIAREQTDVDRSRLRRIVRVLDRIVISMAHSEIDS